jgi:RNA recognition motif-containing protein
LSRETTDASLATYFSKFGEIKDCVVMKDKLNNASRGFGFVTFATGSALDKVLQSKDMEIDGKTIECKVAVPKERMGPPGVKRTKKVFVGGLPSDVKEDQLRNYFSEFGTVTDTAVIYDPQTSRSRGFGFITFDSEDTADLVISKDHTVAGKKIECKKAIPPEMMQGGGGGGMGRGGGRGRGGPAAAYGVRGGGYDGYIDPFMAGYGPFRDYGNYYAAAAALSPYAYGVMGGGYGAGGGASKDRSSRSKSDRSYRPY